MTIQGAAAVQEVPWATVNLLRPFFTPGWRLIAQFADDSLLPAASVTFSNIPGNYRALAFVNQIRTDEAAEGVSMHWRANADAGNNYDRWYFFALGNNTEASGSGLPGNYGYIGTGEGANSRASCFAPSICFFPGYALSDREKFSFFVGCYGGNYSAGADVAVNVYASHWRNTNPITSIQIFSVGGSNLVDGTRLTMYGIL